MDAKELYRQGLEELVNGLYAEALAHFEQSLEVNPEDYNTWEKKAIALTQLDQRELAVAAKAQAHSLYEAQHPPLVQEKTAEDWLQKGYQLYNNGDLQGAIAAYQQSIALDQEYYWAWHNLGLALADQHNFLGAIEAYQQAIDLSPELAQTWQSMGYTLYQLGRYPEAIKAGEKSLSIDPSFYASWEVIGSALYYQRKYEEAVSAYLKC